MTDRTYHRLVELLEAEISDEMVALEPDLGQCFGFNSVAKDVWRALEKPTSFAELRAQLLAEYDVPEEQCGRELQALLDEMVKVKLIAPTEQAG